MKRNRIPMVPKRSALENRWNVVWLGLALGALALVAVEYPEIQRYLKLRSM